jgi:peptidoglycan-associated lipoprotein
MKLQHLILVASLATLAACSSTPSEDQKGVTVEDRTASNGKTSTNSNSQTSTSSSESLVGTPLSNNGNLNTTTQQTTNTTPGSGQYGLSQDLRNPGNILSKRVVYYEYDSFLVRDEFKPVIEAHAKYLLSNKNARLKVEGNTDERGSREYNLALGQKRADAVKRLFVLLGVADARIETVSFGEERPKVEGASENAYAQNRRSELRYEGE